MVMGMEAGDWWSSEMIALQSLLNNLLVIIFPLFLYRLFPMSKLQLSRWNGVFIGASASVSTLLCMCFPVHVGTYMFDLRYVPCIMAMLYGGPVTGLLVAGVLLGGRLAFGFGDGFLATLVVTVVLCAIVLPLSLRFRRRKSAVRIRIIAAITGIGLVVKLLFFLFAPGTEDAKALFLIPFFLTFSIAMLVTALFIEKMIRDAQVAAEHEHYQAERVEKLNLVSQLAASVSHEVRNPLTVIRGFIQLVLATKLSRKQEEYLSMAVTELDRATEIITDFLTFAKPDLEKVEKLALGQELQYIYNMISPYATMQSVETRLLLRTPCWIQGDSQKLRQCMLNLCKNSIEAMPDGGELTLELERIGDQAHVRIFDTGTGMTSEQLKRLGTPYFTTKQKGTGLGMAVVFSIIAAMNGQIDIRSAPSEGTAITMRFAITDPELHIVESMP